MRPAEERKALRDLREARRELDELEPLLLECLARDDQTAERNGFGGAPVSDPVHRAVKLICSQVGRCADEAKGARVRARAVSMVSRRRKVR
jgi:hypothetical protein